MLWPPKCLSAVVTEALPLPSLIFMAVTLKEKATYVYHYNRLPYHRTVLSCTCSQPQTTAGARCPPVWPLHSTCRKCIYSWKTQTSTFYSHVYPASVVASLCKNWIHGVMHQVCSQGVCHTLAMCNLSHTHKQMSTHLHVCTHTHTQTPCLTIVHLSRACNANTCMQLGVKSLGACIGQLEHYN